LWKKYEADIRNINRVMIKKEEYDKALATVQTYNEQLNLHIVNNRTCCVCKEKVISNIEVNIIHPLRQEQGMWADGTVEKITFGYGSKHDMTSYYIAVCDDCITELKESGLATDLKELKKKYASYGT
jgi:hypothetical protein